MKLDPLASRAFQPGPGLTPLRGSLPLELEGTGSLPGSGARFALGRLGGETTLFKVKL